MILFIKGNKNFFSYEKKERKAIISLDALIGTILSVVALVLVFQVFTTVFLNTPSNLKIAESNANSISNFVDFSNNNKDLNQFNDCFTVLKIKNLENFQFQKDKANYFYIIKNDGIYIFKLSDMENFLKTYNFNLKVKYIKFKKPINILIDNTKNGKWHFNAFGYDINSADKTIKLKSNDDYIILLKPLLAEFYTKGVEKYHQNEYELSIINLDKKKVEVNEKISSNLAYIYNTKQLFVPNNEFSLLLIKNNLCSRRNLENNDLNNYYISNPEKIDFMNNIVKFSCYDDNNKKIDGVYEWRNEPVCEDKSNIKLCKNINNFKGLTRYIDFLKKIKDNCLNVGKHPSLKVEGLEKINYKDLKKYTYINKNDLFEELSFNININIKKMKVKINTNKLFNGVSSSDVSKEFINEFKDKYRYDLTRWLSKDIMNGCNNNICNYLIYYNKNAYFYLDGYDGNENKNLRYVKFKNFDMIKKRDTGKQDSDGNEIYEYVFNKESIKFEKRDATEKGYIGIRGDKFFYKTKIKLENGPEYDIILSPEQYFNIRDISN